MSEIVENNPDDYIQKYGSDVMRLFVSFAFSYVDGGPWSDQGIVSMDKFVRRFARTKACEARESVAI